MTNGGGSVLPARLSLHKSDKLTLKADFDAVRTDGRSVAGKLLVVAAVPASDGSLRAGVICGRKFCLLAVVRNRARRLAWESFRQLKPQIAPCKAVFIPRQRIKSAKCADVMAEMEQGFRRLGLWRETLSGAGR